MGTSASSSSDLVREQATRNYVQAARRKGVHTFSINVGDAHRDSKLRNRVPLVCMALKSRKFLQANGLRLVSESGPPSGMSTTVTYTYEFVGAEPSPEAGADPWTRLRGALKDIYAEFGGGESYLRKERERFYGHGEDR